MGTLNYKIGCLDFNVIDGAYFINGYNECKKIIGGDYMINEKQGIQVECVCDNVIENGSGDKRFDNIQCIKMIGGTYSDIRINNYNASYAENDFCFNNLTVDYWNIDIQDDNSLQKAILNFNNIVSNSMINIEFDTISALSEIYAFFDTVDLDNNDIEIEVDYCNSVKSVYYAFKNIKNIHNYNFTFYSAKIDNIYIEFDTVVDSKFNLSIIDSTIQTFKIKNLSTAKQAELKNDYPDIDFIFI